MKTEFVNMIQIFFLIAFFIGIFTYTISSVKNSFKRVNYTFIKKNYVKALDYSRNLITKEYVSFEKYDVWRYCEHF